MNSFQSKTPNDSTEFEREQLSFLLTQGNLATTLAELNPSLAWLSMFAQMGLLKDEAQLVPWIEKNFASEDAIREVVANIDRFGSEAADILEHRLNQTQGLSPLLIKCWRLILRHMRTNKRGWLRSDWFEIQPRIKRGDLSSELLERLANVLRPKLEVRKRISWYDEDNSTEPKRPSDLMSIEYEVEDAITDEEVLATWPENALPATDSKLLSLLTQALAAAVEDATEAGVDDERHYGITDTDVPSVAKHRQNAHRSGFLPIVRVMAEVWTRLAREDVNRALDILNVWRQGRYRLVRRLALFAAANPAVPPEIGADLLLTFPLRELFFTHASVEVYRLVRARWNDFPRETRRRIERRITEGSRADWFREDAEKDRAIDRARFDFLGDFQRRGVQLSPDAERVLNEIRERWPNWELRPEEQGGFHVWHESSSGIIGDPKKLEGVSDEELVAAAKRAADKAEFLEGNAWDALSHTDPARALRGLDAAAKRGKWPDWGWRPFLWAGHKISDATSVEHIARLLLQWPDERFAQVSQAASWWLNENAKTLDEGLLWPIWDRIEKTSSQEVEGVSDE
jgi:hypothetical protein